MGRAARLAYLAETGQLDKEADAGRIDIKNAKSPSDGGGGFLW